MLKKYYAYHLIGLLVMLKYSIRIISDILSPETISLMVLRLFLRLFSTIFFLSLFSSCSIIFAFHSTKDNVYELVLVIHWKGVLKIRYCYTIFIDNYFFEFIFQLKYIF